MAVSRQRLTNSLISHITNDRSIIENYRFLRAKGRIIHPLTRLTIYTGSKNQLIWVKDDPKVEAQRRINQTVNQIKRIYNEIEYIERGS